MELLIPILKLIFKDQLLKFLRICYDFSVRYFQYLFGTC